MKIGLIFKKEFHDRYGAKIEIRSDEITIKRDTTWKFNEVLTIKRKDKNSEGFIEEQFLIETIQLIYLGEWNM